MKMKEKNNGKKRKGSNCIFQLHIAHSGTSSKPLDRHRGVSI